MKITKFVVNVAFFTDKSLINACNLRVTKKARENGSGETYTIFLFNLTFLSKIARKARKLWFLNFWYDLGFYNLSPAV